MPNSAPLELLPRLVWHYNEPFADSSAIPTFVLSELTRRHVTVALNGDAGDENFAGYERYRANVLAQRYDRNGTAKPRGRLALLEQRCEPALHLRGVCFGKLRVGVVPFVTFDVGAVQEQAPLRTSREVPALVSQPEPCLHGRSRGQMRGIGRDR